MNPDGLAVSHLNQFTDAGSLQEGCDLATCTDRVGGEHSDKCEVSRCYFCHRTLGWNDHDWVNTSAPDGSVRAVCDDCFEKGNEEQYLDEVLDMTEGDE